MNFARVLWAVFAMTVTTWHVAQSTTNSSIPSYYDHLQFSLTGPSAYSTAAGGYANPAVYGVLPRFESQFSWSDFRNSFKSFKEWGLFLGGPALGFGVVNDYIPRVGGGFAKVRDWRLAIAGHHRSTSIGLGYGWSTGDDAAVGRSQIAQLGFVHRFGRYVSLGVSGSFALENSNQSGLADVAVRPLGDERVTIFADAELGKGVSAGDAPWSVGARVEPVRGLQLIGRFFEDDSYMFSVGLSLGELKFSGSPRFDKDNQATNTTYEIRSGFPERSALAEAAVKESGYLELNLKGHVKYRRFKYFDSGGHPLYRIISDLEHAINDPAISGVAIRLGGASMSRGKAWEIREKLLEVKRAGKHVVVFVESVGMTQLHLASAADRIVMDPEGMAIIPGYVLGRTFVKEMLEKLGVGFDEWRFLTYKSAAEAFSRTNMSAPDKEQRQELINDLYATVRSDITTGRSIDAKTFDEWVNNEFLLRASEALDLGMVDQIGRWDDVKDVIGQLEGSARRYVGPGALRGNRVPSRLWGEDPKIAIVYALGACEMDSGIHARKLERVFLSLRNDPSIKAVVLRVDSPGGLAIASDVVAVAMRKCQEKKPVIVSQGDVAASGGYWLSMYGDEIFALPTTIVGSIGVIGGWVWDAGIGDKLGHSADHVQVGEHADYFFGIRLLLAGPMLPARNLTAGERKQVIDMLTRSYNSFVEKAAEGRNMSSERMHELAQGHVFSGVEGRALGLVDQLGGMDAAIRAAKAAAGIGEDEVVTMVELPRMGAFNPAALRPFGVLSALFGARGKATTVEPTLAKAPEWTYIRALIENPGRPLYMLPPEYYVEEPKMGQ